MRRLNYFPFALAALMLGACSSNEDVVDSGSGNEVSYENEGYISIDLNLPSTTSTRADDPGVNFDDGTDAEWAVNDATLLIFKLFPEEDGSYNEDKATFCNATALDQYQLQNWNNYTDDNPNQITTKGTITAKIDVPADNSKIYAYVVLNGNGLVKDDNGTWKIAGTSLSTATTFANLKTLATSGIDVDQITNEGFLMNNAPFSNTQGGKTTTSYSSTDEMEIVTLSEIDRSKIYKTVKEAQANIADPATTVYLERTMAKVTLRNASTSNKVQGNESYTYTLKNWDLDVTNKNTYFARNISTSDLKSWLPLISGQSAAKENGYRFAGSSIVENGVALYRTYWAKDMNYDNLTFKGSENFNYTTSIDVTDNATIVSPKYCFENTFNVDNQNQNQTTRVIVALTLQTNSGAADFYALNGSTTTYDEAGLIDLAKNKILNDKVKAWALDKKYSLDKNCLTISGTQPDNGGYIKLDYTCKSGETDITSAIKEVYSTDLLNADLGEIAYYKGGISYYPIRIKHFGDDLTPWDSEEGIDITTSGYPTSGYNTGVTRDGNYLGRYGVLRNNWYDIQINEVIGFGYPEVPTITPNDPDNPGPNTPDDEKASYIACKINVLSWAKRTQSATLQ